MALNHSRMISDSDLRLMEPKCTCAHAADFSFAFIEENCPVHDEEWLTFFLAVEEV